MMDGRRRVSVFRPDGEKPTPVIWFPGASEESIEASIRQAAGISASKEILVLDKSDGCVLAVNEHMPSGLAVEAVPRDRGAASAEADAGAETTEQSALLQSAQKAPELGEQQFRGQLLKFERINAHLANERTWLAWIRTALSLLSCAFTMLGESTSMSSSSWDISYFIMGCLFVGCVDLTWFTGWMRYLKVKEVLALPKELLPPHFGRFRVTYQARLLGVLLTIVMFMYWFSFGG